MINVDTIYLEIIYKILQKYVPECEVRVFGSRINSSPKKYSDLDFAIVGNKKISDDIIYSLKEAFQESDLPFRVDVLDWYEISPEFQLVIQKQYEIIQKAS